MILLDYRNLHIRCRCCYSTDHLVRDCPAIKPLSTSEIVSSSKDLDSTVATKTPAGSIAEAHSPIHQPPPVDADNPTILVDSLGSEKNKKKENEKGVTITNSEETTSSLVGTPTETLVRHLNLNRTVGRRFHSTSIRYAGLTKIESR